LSQGQGLGNLVLIEPYHLIKPRQHSELSQQFQGYVVTMWTVKTAIYSPALHA